MTIDQPIIDAAETFKEAVDRSIKQPTSMNLLELRHYADAYIMECIKVWEEKAWIYDQLCDNAKDV